MTRQRRNILLFALCLFLMLQIIPPFCARAQDGGGKTVRVGWYESPFNFSDRFGRRSGYAYEYQ